LKIDGTVALSFAILAAEQSGKPDEIEDSKEPVIDYTLIDHFAMLQRGYKPV
jgi:hypothetical protein